MRRARGAPRFHEPSLVPMADMLTNTVGVALFILIFTVLMAGGAIVTKRLPMEHETKAKPMRLLCASSRVMPIDLDQMVTEFLKPLGTHLTPENVDDWVKGFNTRKLELDDVVVTGEAEHILTFLRALVTVRPKPAVMRTTAAQEASFVKLRSLLAATKSDQFYMEFMVYPDGITTFRMARDIAGAAGFGTGWSLHAADEPIRVCLAGCGGGGMVERVQ